MSRTIGATSPSIASVRVEETIASRVRATRSPRPACCTCGCVVDISTSMRLILVRTSANQYADCGAYVPRKKAQTTACDAYTEMRYKHFAEGCCKVRETMTIQKSVTPASLAAQAMGWIDPVTKAVVPPIHMASTYQRDEDNAYRSGRIYARADNPTFDQAETTLAALEGGAKALIFSSGMSAATACFLALAPGDHVVAPKVMYWSLRNWLGTFATNWGLRIEFVDADRTDAIAAAVKPRETKLVWLETPANPTWAVSDIAAAAEIAHKAGARLAVDSTVATPVLTRPIEHGADIVMH